MLRFSLFLCDYRSKMLENNVDEDGRDDEIRREAVPCAGDMRLLLLYIGDCGTPA